MNLFSKGAALLLGLVMATAGAMASMPTPPRFVRLDGTASSARDIRILQAFSTCAVRHHFSKTRARAVLALDPASPEYGREILEIAGRSTQCVPGRGSRLRFSRLPFAGYMAEALMGSDHVLGDLAARVALNPALPPLQARDEADVMSICMVRAAPGEVASLFATQPASDEERAALRAIMPRAGECLTAGASVRLNALSARAMLAVAAWRLVEHNRAATAANPDRQAQGTR